MNPTWFDRHWCYIGLAAGVLLLPLLFSTNIFRQRLDISRWHDPVWLSWLLVPTLLIHQFEEYGFDAVGRTFDFPAALCGVLGYEPLANCPIPHEFFAFVNISAAWVGAVVAALLSRRNHAVGVSYIGLLIVNALTHIGQTVVQAKYGPGLLTALLLFLPLSGWIIHTCFGPGRLRYQTLAAILLAGVLLHAVLMVSIQLVLHGVINGAVVDAIQVINPLWLLLLPWAANKKWPPNERALASQTR